MKRFLAALSLTTAVLAFVPVPLVAQTSPQPPAAPQPPAPGYATPVQNAEQLREQFNEVMRRYPRNVGRVLRMDPTLFNDPSYLANYPAIQQFVAQYPEIARTPEYYLAEYSTYYEDRSTRDPRQQALDMMRNWVEMFMVFVIIVAVSLAVLWLIKSLVDHRRWLRMSKIQTEVHTKLLDRFSTSDELLAYMKTPAGSRFLESAPILVDATAANRPVSAPVSRILWSVQAGVVLLLAGLSFFVCRNWTTFQEVRDMFAIMGTFGSFIGLGFILSAGLAWVLSNRLGLMNGTAGAPPSSVSASRVDSAGL